MTIRTTTADELCPGCDTGEGVRWTGSTPDTDSWVCNSCGHEWTIAVAVPAHATLSGARSFG
jgi:transposase-like protein